MIISITNESLMITGHYFEPHRHYFVLQRKCVALIITRITNAELRTIGHYFVLQHFCVVLQPN